MKQPQNLSTHQFYEVTMRVEVTRRVLARSKEEALEKVDTSDMTHEYKHYGADEELIVEPVDGDPPTVYDLIDDIGNQIVQNHHNPMYQLKELYAEIRELNQQLENAGHPTYEPRILNQMNDGFLKALRSES